jgi:hypothetical protein
MWPPAIKDYAEWLRSNDYVPLNQFVISSSILAHTLDSVGRRTNMVHRSKPQFKLLEEGLEHCNLLPKGTGIFR